MSAPELGGDTAGRRGDRLRRERRMGATETESPDRGRLLSGEFRGLVQGNAVFRLLPVLWRDDHAGRRRLAHALPGELADLFLLIENGALAHRDLTLESGSGIGLAGKAKLTPVEMRP